MKSIPIQLPGQQADSNDIHEPTFEDANLYRLASYDYDLPDALIAKYPLARRDGSKMLHLPRQNNLPAEALAHRHFFDLPQQLQSGDLIVANNTQVLPARLYGNRQGFSGRIEILLLYPDPKSQPHPEFGDIQWLAMTRPTRKLQAGTVIELPDAKGEIVAAAKIIHLGKGVRTIVRINLEQSTFQSVGKLMDAVGHMPIPPYLKRPDEPTDKITYQTVYAKSPGSQAAPTAGLHFTPELIGQLKAKGVDFAELTLSVSSGTFRSVDTEDIRQHAMDPEHYALSEETAEKIRQTKSRGGRVIAVGTTSLKTLETIAHLNDGHIVAGSGWSQLFIYPGFKFQVVDGLITNFHLPRTTLLMLVSAFCGFEKIQAAYKQAVQNEYRFFSYGDCMLIL